MLRWLLLRRISPDGVFTMYDLGSSVCRITVPLTDSWPLYTHTSVSFGISRASLA